MPPVFLHQSMPEAGPVRHGGRGGVLSGQSQLLDGPKGLYSGHSGGCTWFVAPGGMLVFDVNTAAKLAALDGQVFLDETEDTYCVWRTEYHRGLCTYYMDLFRRRGDGAWRRSAEVHRQRAYSVEELTAWLAAAGFGDVRVYGDMRMRRPRADEQRVYISCVRK